MSDLQAQAHSDALAAATLLAIDPVGLGGVVLRAPHGADRDAFERDPAGFAAQWQDEDERIRKQLVRARKRLLEVEVPDAVREQSAKLCMALGTDGLRGDLTLVRAARALAALDSARKVTTDHLRRIAAPALRHRLRRNPLDDSGSTVRVDRAVAEHLAAA